MSKFTLIYATPSDSNQLCHTKKPQIQHLRSGKNRRAMTMSGFWLRSCGATGQNKPLMVITPKECLMVSWVLLLSSEFSTQSDWWDAKCKFIKEKFVTTEEVYKSYNVNNPIQISLLGLTLNTSTFSLILYKYIIRVPRFL